MGPGYSVLTVNLADVVAIRDDLNLLDGQLTFSTSTGAAITVPYNGSAHSMATRLVNELRAITVATQPSPVGRALLAAGNATADVAAVPRPGSADAHLVSRFLELRVHNQALVVWASHGRRRVNPGATGLDGLVARVSHFASPATTHGLAVLADDNALEFLGRRASLVRGRNADYSSSRLVVPFGAIDGLDLSAHPVYPDVTTLTITAGAVVDRRPRAERLGRGAATFRGGTERKGLRRFRHGLALPRRSAPLGTIVPDVRPKFDARLSWERSGIIDGRGRCAQAFGAPAHGSRP